MAFARAARLSHLLTPTYAARINAQLVHPAPSVVVKPHELASALMRPSQTAVYEPERSAVYLAATMAYGLMKGAQSRIFGLAERLAECTPGHPFMDGNKRTGAPRTGCATGTSH